MVPTLPGRLQTRLFSLLAVGGLTTLLVTPLAGTADAAGYRASGVVLAAVALLGLAWELLYHLLQQFRWEKDWPTLFGLLTAVPEGLAVAALLRAGLLPTGAPVPTARFAVLFCCVWLTTWLWLNGPMRVPFTRWRFRGGRVL